MENPQADWATFQSHFGTPEQITATYIDGMEAVECHSGRHLLLYRFFRKLQEQGFVSDRKVLVGKRMTRVYYHIEPTGEERLKQLLRDYERIAEGLRMILGYEIPNI